MSRIVRGRVSGRAIVWIFAAASLGIGPESETWPDQARAAAVAPAQDPAGTDPFGQPPTDDRPTSRPRQSRPVRKRGKAPSLKKSASKDEAKPSTSASTSASTDGLKFSVDVAPILVANCSGCHSKEGIGLRRGKLDLSSFDSLQKGTPAHKVIVPGKPEESHLVLRINGEEDPKMPQGANRALSAEAIATITRWVKEGARIDAGIDPKKPMESYAATPEQLRRMNLARMSPKDRDEKTIAAGHERWKQSGAKQKAEVTPGTHFLLFSNLPADRASSVVKGLETQYNPLRRMLGARAMDWPEKVSLYVFNENNTFVEFIRTVEGRDFDQADPKWSVRFDVPQPYIAAADPAGGGKELPAPKRRGRGRKSSDEAEASPDRTLLGVLTEAMGNGSVAAAGNAPRWLREGIGAYLASSIEPRSPYYRHLRQAAFQAVQQGWPTRGAQALGDQLPADELRAAGFGLVECLTHDEYFRQGFRTFLVEMLEQGGAGLDDVLKGVYNGNREQFLQATETWIANAYGQVR